MKDKVSGLTLFIIIIGILLFALIFGSLGYVAAYRKYQTCQKEKANIIETNEIIFRQVGYCQDGYRKAREQLKIMEQQLKTIGQQKCPKCPKRK